MVRVSRNAGLRNAVWMALLVVYPVIAATQGGLSLSRKKVAAGPAARVVVAQDPATVNAFVPDPRKVRSLVQRGIKALAGTGDANAAWLSFVGTNETVGIKIYTSPGPSGGTRREVVAAVIEGLLSAGLPATNIIVWDKFRADLRLAGYFDLEQQYGVRVAASADTGYDVKQFYESALLGNLVWGDHEFGQKGEGIARKSYVSRLVSQEMTKIISITPMLNHNLAGVTGHLYGLALGSVDNMLRFEKSRVYMDVAVPEIVALPILGDRVVLNITDALICQYQGEQRSLLHYSATLNELRFSTDPVALDVLSIRELDRQRTRAEIESPRTSMELYKNAELVQIGIADPDRIKTEEAK